MANSSVSDLTASSALIGTELFYADNGSSDVKVTATQIQTLCANPAQTDGDALGSTSLQWSDLFLAEGAVINWDSGDLTLTQTDNDLALQGGGGLVVGNSLSLTTFGASTLQPIIQMLGVATGTSSIGGVRFSANTSSPEWIIAKSRGSSIGSYTVVNDNDILGIFGFQGSDGTDLARGASIFARVDGTPGNNAMPTELIISTCQSGSQTPTERVRVAPSGNFTPAISNSCALGTASTYEWSDLFLASGGVINWDNGDFTATHSANALTFSGAVATSKSTLTIASGAVTATKSYHLVDTEGASASDDLDTISGGVDGMRLVLRAADSTHTVVVKDNTGNIQGPGDVTLDNREDTVELIFDSTLSQWLVISASNNGA